MAPSPSTSVAPARPGQRAETTSPTTSTSDRTAPSTPSSTATNHYRWRLRQPCAGSGGAASIKSPIFGSALTAWVAGRSHLGRHLRGERSQVVAGRWLRCRAATLPWCSSSADGRAAWAAAILTPARPLRTKSEDAGMHNSGKHGSQVAWVRWAAVPLLLVLVSALAATAAAAPAAEVIVLPGASSAEGIAAGRGATFYA